MEIKIVKAKSGNVWKFVNESWSNSRAWGHKTTVFFNNYDYEPHKVTYLNRTWECYTYQTCMRGAINVIEEQELNRYIEDYKYNNNIYRFKKGEKENVIKEFKGTTLGQDLEYLKECIRDRKFDE